jgi:hypothetical protein
MRTTESVTLEAPSTDVFPFVADLAVYPRWLPLVHEAVPTGAGADDRPAWDVELRARIGPFARSKRLRMERIELEPDQLVVFERAEIDGRQHARWSLRVEIAGSPGADETTVTMHLAYDGRLWTGGLLESALDEQIRRGREGLALLVSGDATP